MHIHAFRSYRQAPDVAERLDRIEAATDARMRLTFAYRDESGAETTRTVRPLGLWFWGLTWTMVGWCELRDDFRMFRVDRMRALTEDGPFKPQPGQTLQDFRKREASHGFPH